MAEDSRTLTIRYVRGDRDCFRLDHVDKQELSGAVTVGVFVAVCDTGGTDIYQEDTTEVHLNASLAGRQLIEGCSAQAAPSARKLQDVFVELARRTERNYDSCSVT